MAILKIQAENQIDLPGLFTFSPSRQQVLPIFLEQVYNFWPLTSVENCFSERTYSKGHHSYICRTNGSLMLHSLI